MAAALDVLTHTSPGATLQNVSGPWNLPACCSTGLLYLFYTWLCFVTGKKLQGLQQIQQLKNRWLICAAWILQFPFLAPEWKIHGLLLAPAPVFRMSIARILNLVLFMCCLPNLTV